MRAAGLFRVSDFRQPRAFACARVSSFCVSGCTVFRKQWVFRSARRGLIPCFLLAACRSCILRVYGALSVLRTGGFFLVLQAMWFARRAAGWGNAAPSHPSLRGIFPPKGGGGGTDSAQQRNTGTALCVFARERTRARRFVCLQRERVRALCAAFVHTHDERICARARHSALMQSGKADVVRRARVREQGRFIEAVFFRMAAPQRLFEPEQVAAALGGLA